MIVSCKSRIRVPSAKVRVNVGWISTGAASFGKGTGLGVGAGSLTATSFELREIVSIFNKTSSEFDSDRLTVVLSAFLVP